jgi:hypothetical protein
MTQQKKDWRYRYPNRVLKTAEKTRNKAKAEARFRCDICEQNLATQVALDKHNDTQAHLARVAGLQKPEITKSAVAVKAVRKQAKDDKLHYCSVFAKAFNNDWSLQRHLATPLHAKKGAKPLVLLSPPHVT